MKDISHKTLAKIRAGKTPTFEELKPVLRPEGVQNGVLKVDPDKCTSCGLCIQNCPFKCWEMGENKIPGLKEGYACFSCFNCMVACPVDAISIVQTYGVAKGYYYDTGFPPVKMPQEPKDAEGNPAEWNEVERIIMNRRSARNFKEDPVPEPLIRRVLEAGRFAQSAGNHQPWKFAVVTYKKVIAELEEVAYNISAALYNSYIIDDTAMEAFAAVGGTLPAPVFDFRVMAGYRAVVRRDLPIYLKAPCVIFLGAHKNLVGAEMQIGICGQNMCLTAISLGLGCCLSNFGREVNHVPEIKARLGFDDQWDILTSMCLGYPKFKQSGIVPRMSRPVTWIRPGSDKPQVEE